MTEGEKKEVRAEKVLKKKRLKNAQFGKRYKFSDSKSFREPKQNPKKSTPRVS